MRKNLFYLIFFFSFKSLFSQDQLIKKDGSILSTKIIEIGIYKITYKLYNNLNGSNYKINLEEVKLIIFANGKELLISTTNKNERHDQPMSLNLKKSAFKKDSSQFFKYHQSISLNFFDFGNNELSLIYQREFYQRKINLILPFAVGFSAPAFTQDNYYPMHSDNAVILNRKTYDLGLGVNYYFNLNRKINYYIGPLVKYMQFDVTQAIKCYLNNRYGPYVTVHQNSILTRYTASLTSGFIIRTRNRLIFNVFASFGILHDSLSEVIIDPYTMEQKDLVFNPVQAFFWAGACVGYSF